MKNSSVLQNISLKGSAGLNLNRRDFVKTAATAATFALAGGNLMSTVPASTLSQGGTKKRIWIDTHIHVSDIGEDGKKRERMLDDLLDVLDRSDADLRFAISPHAGYIKNMITDPAAMYEANKMVYDLCRRAPGRLYGSCMVNPNFLDEALRVMKICFEEWGFVQLGELLPFRHNYRMND